MDYMPLITCLVSLVFGITVLDQYFARRGFAPAPLGHRPLHVQPERLHRVLSVDGQQYQSLLCPGATGRHHHVHRFPPHERGLWLLPLPAGARIQKGRGAEGELG